MSDPICGDICGVSKQYDITTLGNTGRSERIRTSDPVVPNDVRYQAALHSVTSDARI
jgi:hypothetical protein